MLGNTYCIREAVLTPQCDARGMLTDADKLEAPGKYATRSEPVSEDEKKRMCQMFRSKRTIIQIAAEFCRPYDLVNRILLENGIRIAEKKGRPWTEEEKQRVAMMYMEGKPFDMIASAVGRSAGSIGNLIATMRRREEI